jgi:hypothetical protein
MDADSRSPYEQASDQEIPRLPSPKRHGIALGLVLTPVLLILCALVIVWFTPLHFANRSFAWELRASYEQSSGMVTTLSNPGPRNGFSMSNPRPDLVYIFLRGGPVLYSFSYAYGKAMVDPRE